MPVICVFENENIKIYIYNYDHRAPHIHIVKKGSTPKKGVDMLLDGSLPHGSEGLSKQDIDLVRAWLVEHVEEVGEKWDRAESGELTADSPIPSSNGSITESVEAGDSNDNIYVSNVVTLPERLLLCEFNEGNRYVLFDMAPLLNKQAFFRLNSDDIFKDIDFSNGVPSWDNERIDIAPEYIFEHGIQLSRSEYNYLNYISTMSGDDSVKIPLINGFVECIKQAG